MPCNWRLVHLRVLATVDIWRHRPQLLEVQSHSPHNDHLFQGKPNALLDIEMIKKKNECSVRAKKGLWLVQWARCIPDKEHPWYLRHTGPGPALNDPFKSLRVHVLKNFQMSSKASPVFCNLVSSTIWCWFSCRDRVVWDETRSALQAPKESGNCLRPPHSLGWRLSPWPTLPDSVRQGDA